MNSPIEQAANRNTTSRRRKIIRAASIAGIAIGSYTMANNQAPVSKPSTEEVGRKTDEAALVQTKAKDTAEGYATAYSEALSAGYSLEGLRILNGTLDIMSKTGGFIPGNENPILLSTMEDLDTSDIDMKSLENGWVGIQSTDENGRVLIIPTPLDGKLARFVPNDEEQLFLPDSVGVYATEAELSPGFHEMQLIAYDMEGEVQLKSPDGSPIQPGLSITWANVG